MPVEPKPNNAIEQNAEPFSEVIAHIQALWQELSDAYQVALALELVGSILKSPYRPYLRYAMTQQWPISTAEFHMAFPKFEITEDDLLNVHLDEEDLAQLAPAHLEEMAETMRSHFIQDLFWPELRYVACSILEKLSDDHEPVNNLTS